MAQSFAHPRVLTTTGGNLPGSMRLTFLVSLLGMALLYVTLWKLELTAKNTSNQLRRLRRRLELEVEEGQSRAGAPAPPVSTVPASPSEV
ncbi:MAG TPA: hypothetical protein VGF74_15300, partial [Thermoleophilaceae bacterium]